MQDVCAIFLTAVSRRELCYVSESKQLFLFRMAGGAIILSSQDDRASGPRSHPELMHQSVRMSFFVHRLLYFSFLHMLQMAQVVTLFRTGS